MKIIQNIPDKLIQKKKAKKIVSKNIPPNSNQIFIGKAGCGKSTRIREHMLSKERETVRKIIIHDNDEYDEIITLLQHGWYQYYDLGDNLNYLFQAKGYPENVVIQANLKKYHLPPYQKQLVDLINRIFNYEQARYSNDLRFTKGRIRPRWDIYFDGEFATELVNCISPHVFRLCAGYGIYFRGTTQSIDEFNDLMGGHKAAHFYPIYATEERVGEFHE